MATNRVIGKNNQLIWHMPADLKFFKQKTTGSYIIMGRKTYESVGKPLPNRTNIVITRQDGYQAEGCIVVGTLDSAIRTVPDTEKEVFIVGGAQIYEEALDTVATHIYLTQIHHEFEGDTFFPEFALNRWHEIWREDHDADEKNPYNYSYVLYEKKKGDNLKDDGVKGTESE